MSSNTKNLPNKILNERSEMMSVHLMSPQCRDDEVLCPLQNNDGNAAERSGWRVAAWRGGRCASLNSGFLRCSAVPVENAEFTFLINK